MSRDFNDQFDEIEPPSEGSMNYPRISEFFRGKTVAITGGTGFLGQGIIEKLLRCCPQIHKIILFIRRKRGVGAKIRLQHLIKQPVFDVLHRDFPEFVEKLSFVSCDLEATGLGLDSSVRLSLLNEVEIFIHSAACLRFNENLKMSYVTNVQSVRRIVDLCKEMMKLKAFVHISSAYSHCDRSHINDELYECDIDYRLLESVLKCLDDSMIKKITPDLLGKRPNTYTFTKALSEDVIARESGDIPVCIARPSMIIPAWQEPSPGWCSNVYGPTAFFVAYGKGVLRSVIADENVVADLIPVDLVVNGIIAATVKTACDYADNGSSTEVFKTVTEASFAEEEENGQDISGDEGTSGAIVHNRRSIPIYQFTTGELNPLYIRDLVKYGKHWYNHYPLDPHRLPHVSLTCNRLLHKVKTFALQTIPAYIDDALLFLTNQERTMKVINQKIMAGMEVMEFFFTKEWTWGDANTQRLRDFLHPQDEKIFNFDPRVFSWKEELKHYVIGTRKYLVKQDMSSYPTARRMLERLKIQHSIMKSFLVIGFLCLLISSSGLLTRLVEWLVPMFQQPLTENSNAV